MARAVVVGATVGIVIGAFLPWIISGQRTRNSFTTVQLARALGVVEHETVLVMMAGWYFVPLGVVMVVVLAALDHQRSCAVMAAAIGAVAVAFALIVRFSPVATDVGVAVTLGAGVLTVVASVILFGGAVSPVEPRD